MVSGGERIPQESIARDTEPMGAVTIVLALKTLIDFLSTVALLWQQKNPLALMFLGFSIADAGALWIAIR